MTISLSNINSMRTLAFATRIMEASRRSSRPLVVFKGTHTCESCWRGPSLNRISPIERLCAVGSTPAVERRATSKQRKHRSPPGEGFASLMFQCQESWALYRPLWLELCLCISWRGSPIWGWANCKYLPGLWKQKSQTFTVRWHHYTVAIALNL